MSGARPPSGPTDDGMAALIARLPAPALPADLAVRIVAQATLLPQQARREDVVAVVERDDGAAPMPMPVPAGARSRRSYGWLAGAAGMAVAASLALMLMPPRAVNAPGPVARKQAGDSAGRRLEATAPGARSATTATELADQAPATPIGSGARRIAPRGTLPPQPLDQELAGNDDAAGADAAIDPTLATTILTGGDAPKPASGAVAEMIGPKPPVQGPPVPPDLMPGGTRGFGVTGSSLELPPELRPSPGPGAGRGPGPGGPPRR